MAKTYRTERDALGDVQVPTEALWGAQTQRSLDNFRIGQDRIPEPVIRALLEIKRAAAQVNHALLPERMTEEKRAAITGVCDKILSDYPSYAEMFPLSVFQTGSGTQTNMNVNEVICRAVNLKVGKALCHPNDDINMSQSSNDVFPAAMHIAAAMELEHGVLPALNKLEVALEDLIPGNENRIKCGRTHLQDATPVRFSQEIFGWLGMLATDYQNIDLAQCGLFKLALGGTAVGTGLNCPEGFDRAIAKELAKRTGIPFRTHPNKFQALTGRTELSFAHGALKALAADLMKIANDIRFLASGPRAGYGELKIPENEPGSSIMPGKVNPTQCEAVCMVAVQVMADDLAVNMAASQGNFELNVYAPVLISNFLRSTTLLTDAMRSFTEHCVKGIEAIPSRMQADMERSLMLVTALSPEIGYAKAAEIAHLAYAENLTLKAACLKLGYLDEARFDELVKPERMAGKTVEEIREENRTMEIEEDE